MSAVINRVVLMRMTESGFSATIVLRPSKAQHQPFLKRTPSSKSQWVEIDFDPPEKLVYIIHLFSCKLQRDTDMKFERHHRRRLLSCPSSASPLHCLSIQSGNALSPLV